MLSTGLTDPHALQQAAVEENVLGKSTSSGRVLTFRHMTSLYGLNTQPPITKALFALWKHDPAGRRVNALLVALVRDPLLRDTTNVVLDTPVGAQVQRASVEAALAAAHPNRMSEKLVRSLAQNCNSTWTQSGHLKGRAKKIRHRLIPTPSNVAFATIIATVCGFGGPAIVDSIWIQ